MKKQTLNSGEIVLALMTGARIEASRRSGVGSGSMRSGLRGYKPRFLRAGGGARGASGGGSSNGHKLPLPPSRSRNPRALHVSSAIEPSAPTAGSAASMATIFLRLIPTVLTRGRRRRRRSQTAGTADSPTDQFIVSSGGIMEVMIERRRRRFLQIML